MAIENLERRWSELHCPAEASEEIFWHEEGSGKGYSALGLKCRANGRRVWIWEYRGKATDKFPNGRKRRRTYGSPNDDVSFDEADRNLSYDDAQRRVILDRAAIAEGRDPAADKKAAKDTKGRTIGDLLKLYFADKETSIVKRTGEPRRANYITDIKQQLEPFRLQLGERTATSVTRTDIHAVLDAYNKKPAMQQAIQRQINAFFRWCADRHELPHVSKGMEQRGSSKSRAKFLDDTELKLLLPELRAIGYPLGDAMLLMLATGRRLMEVLEAEWCEFGNLEERLWTLPGSRAKNHETHELPLSDFALRILRDAAEKKIGVGKYVFHRPGVDAPVATLAPVLDRVRKVTAPATSKLRRPEQRVQWSAHDLRRTAATIMEDVLGVPNKVIKRVLNHAKIVDVTDRYTRGDLEARMRKALDDLAAHYEAFAGATLALPKPTLALPAPAASDQAEAAE